MFGSETLDVVIGLLMVFLIFSVLLTALTELVEARLKTRAADLEKAVREMLRDPDSAKDATEEVVAQFYKHPLIAPLYRETYQEGASSGRKRRSNLPSYIPRDVFSTAVLDMMAKEEAPAGLKAVVERIQTVYGDDVAARKAQLESWYDGVMDRASGWYKRRTQGWLLILGFVLAIAFNINTITLAQYLSESDEARAALVKMAAESVGTNTSSARGAESGGDAAGSQAAESQTRTITVGDCGSGTGTDAIIKCRKAINEVGLPIGWSDFAWKTAFQEAPLPTGLLSLLSAFWVAKWSVLVALVGWAITAVAGTLGAPFWFDILNKVMVVRATVKPKEKSGDERSEDR